MTRHRRATRLRETNVAGATARRVLACAWLLACLPAVAAVDWAPPIGIPAPPFGIRETHAVYEGKPGYRNARDGAYTVYVDNSAAGCSDSGPATAEQPRCTIPGDIPSPGSVVEVHGGPYEFDGADITIDANGKSTQPVFLRGIDDGEGFPVIYDADTVTLQGRWFIVENFVFDRSQVRNIGKTPSAYGNSHIAIRNVEIKNHPAKNGSVLAGSHVVFYRNHVHHNQGNDRHGATVGPGADHVWILDSHFHHNGGDAVQLCHRCSDAPPRFVYIGRNLMHSDRENGVDLKFVENIVISQNEIHGYQGAPADVRWCFDDGSSCGTFGSGSDGSAVVIGSAGAPVNPWIIFNDIHGSRQGIRIEEVADVWIVGNTIHDIAGRAFALEKDGDPVFIVNNTIYNVDRGIDQYWRRNFELHIHNNIFANVRGVVFHAGREVASRAAVENNLFWGSGDSMLFEWGRFEGPASDSSDVRSMLGDGNRVGDPAFVDAAGGDFRLLETSAAIDSSSSQLQTVDERFQEIFGRPLSTVMDEHGISRPADGNADGDAVADVGSHEYLPCPANASRCADEVPVTGE